MEQRRTFIDWPLTRLLPAAWCMATIWWLSDREQLPSVPGFSDYVWSVIGHFTVFGLLGLCVWFALGMDVRILNRERTWFAIGIATAYGVLDEIHQHFVPGRHPDVLDVITDFIGATFFVLVIPRLYQRWFG